MNVITILLKFLNEKYYNNDISLSLLLLNFDGLSIDKTDLDIFNNFILNNGLLHQVVREKATQMFSIVQKFKHGIIRLQHCYRSKKCKTYDVDTDLNLTPMSTYKDEDKITLIENKTKYTFTIVDLIKIINNALTSSEYMSANVHHPRNPYTNNEFSPHNMYNIMLKLQTHKSYITLKSHIISYFQQNLDLKKYYEHNRTFLKKIAVEHYIETEDTNSLFQYVCEMFEDYPDHTHIVIDVGLRNKDFIINKVKPMLYYYLLLQQFSHTDELTLKYQNKFLDMLKDFTKKNQTFGRITYRRRLSSGLSSTSSTRSMIQSSSGIFIRDDTIIDTSNNLPLFASSNPFSDVRSIVRSFESENEDANTTFPQILPSIRIAPSELFPLQIPNSRILPYSTSFLQTSRHRRGSTPPQTPDSYNMFSPPGNEGLPSLEELVNTTLTNTGERKEEEEEDTNSIITQTDNKESIFPESTTILSPIHEHNENVSNDETNDIVTSENTEESGDVSDTEDTENNETTESTIVEHDHHDEYENVSDAHTEDTNTDDTNTHDTNTHDTNTDISDDLD